MDSISFRLIRCFSGVKYWGCYCLARDLSLRFSTISLAKVVLVSQIHF